MRTGLLVRCSAAPLLLHDDRRADPDAAATEIPRLGVIVITRCDESARKSFSHKLRRKTIERFDTDKKEKARLLKLVSKAANLLTFPPQTRPWALDLGLHRPKDAENLQLTAKRPL
jgi:hypothetical protein